MNKPYEILFSNNTWGVPTRSGEHRKGPFLLSLFLATVLSRDPDLSARSRAPPAAMPAGGGGGEAPA
jgi:hypothetical protein